MITIAFTFDHLDEATKILKPSFDMMSLEANPLEIPRITPPQPVIKTAQGFPLDWVAPSTIAIKMGNPFLLSEICKTKDASARNAYKAWLQDNFDVDIVLKEGNNVASVRNPYLVMPYHTERGIKHYATQATQPSKHGVKGAAPNFRNYQASPTAGSKDGSFDY